MKKAFLLAAVALFVSVASAQTTVNDKTIKADVGFGSAVGGIPVGVSYEQGIVDLGGAFITLGGYVGYDSSTENYSYFKWKLSQLNIMVQGNYYLAPIVDKLDLYAGLRLGYANVTSTYIYDDHDSEYDWGSPFSYSAHVGANYWFSNSFAVNAELGYGIAYLNVGVAYKF